MSTCYSRVFWFSLHIVNISRYPEYTVWFSPKYWGSDIYVVLQDLVSGGGEGIVEKVGGYWRGCGERTPWEVKMAIWR